MKLTEVINEIEKGSKSEFKHICGCSFKPDEYGNWIRFNKESYVLPLDGWEEINTQIKVWCESCEGKRKIYVNDGSGLGNIEENCVVCNGKGYNFI